MIFSKSTYQINVFRKSYGTFLTFVGLIPEFEELIPDRVREALKVFVEIVKIILDNNNEDKTIREEVFTKVSREKIQKALHIFEEW